jgi:signal transduction histidine kinase
MRSLVAPMVAGLVLSLTLMFGVQWSLVQTAIDAVMQDYMAEQLAQDSEELFGGLGLKAGGGLSMTVAHFDPVYLTPSSGRYFQILAGGAVVLSSPSLAAERLSVPLLKRGQRQLIPLAGPMNQALLLSATGYELQGQPVTIAVAADMNPMQTSFKRLMRHYALVSLLMFALLVALQVGIVRLALAPLRRVQADVGRLERGEIGQLGEYVPAEVLPLVREVNQLLDLLTRRLQRSRESLGNLAHALKAPLTVLTHMAEDEQVHHDPIQRQKMMEQLEILSHRIDSELRRARIAGAGKLGVPVNLEAELQSLLETLRKLYRERHLDIACQVEAGMAFHGDREDLLELCGNLLDNACKWAQSRVLVSVTRDKGLLLRVADDGPGCSPEGLQLIAQRGVRLDESTHGHGLGLAIASGIASCYGATLQFGRSQELGGFEVSVAFAAG